MIVTNDSYPFMAVNHGRIVWLVMGLIWFILWLFIRLRSKKTPIYRLFTYVYQLNMVIFHSKLLNYQRVNGFVRKWPGEAYTAKKTQPYPCFCGWSHFLNHGIKPDPSIWRNSSLVGPLVVLTILKNISEWEGLSHILWKINMFETTNQY